MSVNLFVSCINFLRIMNFSHSDPISSERHECLHKMPKPKLGSNDEIYSGAFDDDDKICLVLRQIPVSVVPFSTLPFCPS